MVNKESSGTNHYLSPRYWPTWVSLAVLWCIARLPYRWQMSTGSMLGRLLYHAARHRRHVAEVNIRLCFPELSETAQQQMLAQHFVSLGKGLVETAMSWWTPEHKLVPLTQIEGLENLEQALTGGHGVILLSAHFTSLEIGGRLLVAKTPFHVMYRPHKNALFEAIMKHSREQRFEKAIRREDVRGMLKSLKEGKPVWYAPDQNYGAQHSIFVPFFGIPASTITATSRLAKISGAPVVPFFTERLDENRGYRLRILPALADLPTDDIELDTTRLNEMLESEIRRIPAQYLWVHRRFKTRPPGSPGVY